jgi:beta-galactosidase
MRVGVDYYPEYWPEARWAEDAELMKAAGINTVRLAEFAWSRLEPKDGEFDFDWLERVIGVLTERGISTLLCTPTAAPPPWMTTAHRDILPRDARGTIRDAGGRRHYCPNSITYRRYCARIVRKMAERFGTNDAVVAWHLDNELGCHDTAACYCDACSEAFRNWLIVRYGTVAELNRRWGGAFWSGEYTDWDQVPLPWYNVAGHSPSLVLDFKRFCTRSYVEFAKAQLDVLHEVAPAQPVTTNLMGRFSGLDYYELADILDFVAWDNYPDYGCKPHVPALGADIMRGVARGKRVWVVEEQVGPTNWGRINTQPRPGACRLWTYQQIAHGAEAVLFFRWRACTGGREKLHSGVLAHDGLADSRAYEEVSRIGQELARASAELEGARLSGRVAMLYSYDDIWAADYEPRPTQRLGWLEHFELYYRAFHRANIPVDIVHPAQDLSAYRLVVAPMLHIVTPEIRRNLEAFVSAGGTFVTTIFSGFCDDCAVVTGQPLPGELRELLGIRIKEWDPLPESARNAIRPETDALPRTEYAVDYWADVIELEGAEAIASFRRDYHADAPAVTAHAFGDGTAVYVGTVGDEWLFADLVSWLVELAGLDAPVETPPGVEYRTCESASASYTFLLNHNDTSVSVELTRELADLFTGRPVSGTVIIGPRDLLVVREMKSRR